MQIAQQRLARNYLLASPFTTAPELIRALGAVQAQDYEGAKWAAAQRVPGITDEVLERAFTTGEILRTHLLRPTWHFVDPADIRWMLALTGPFVKKRMAGYDRQLGLDEKVFRRCNNALANALADGQCLTRAELKGVLGRARVEALGVQRTAHILMQAELDALIVSGPRRGKQFTYALLDRRAPALPPRDRDEALRDLALRYFRTRSPATAQDFSWWSGLPMTDVRKAIDLAGQELETSVIDGTKYWIAGDLPRRVPPSAHLLPNYDEFFIGHRDRGAIGKRLKSVKAVTGGTTLISHVIAVDGQLVGGWRRVNKPAGIELRLSLLTKLTPAEHQRLKKAVKRFEQFAGQPVTMA